MYLSYHNPIMMATVLIHSIAMGILLHTLVMSIYIKVKISVYGNPMTF
jgi:hypothetical protein